MSIKSFEAGCDVIFLNPFNIDGIYQNLANDYAAIEPPTWALLLAQSVRSQGFKTAIIDANAEHLTDDQILTKIVECPPPIVMFCCLWSECKLRYGQHVRCN